MSRRITGAISSFFGILLVGSAWAATISVGDGAVRPGGTVEIAVVVDADSDLGGVNLRFEYDPLVFPVADFSSGPLFDESHVVQAHSPAPGRFNVVAYAPPGAPSLPAQAANLFSISLKVSPSAATGEYPVTYSTTGASLLATSGMSDLDGISVAHTAHPGSVTVFESLVTDLNKDGGVTGADLILLLTNWHQYSVDPPPQGDITGDNEVDTDDLMSLLKDWEVTPSAVAP